MSELGNFTESHDIYLTVMQGGYIPKRPSSESSSPVPRPMNRLALAILSGLIAAGCTAPGKTKAAGDGNRAISESGETARLPQDPALQRLLAAGIAHRVVEPLEYRRTLTVRSLQTVSFASDPLEGKQAIEFDSSIRDPRSAIAALPSITAQVEVESTMTRDSMRATFKRPADVQPQLILELSTEDGKPMFRETHWYADRNAYVRGAPYQAAHASGVEELKVDHSMWAEIEAQGAPVCALADFFYTWLGRQSLRVSGLRFILSESTRVERRDGDGAFLLTRPCYDDRSRDSRNSRIDRFIVSADFRLVAWSSEYINARAGSTARYMVIDRTYAYGEGD